MIGDDQPTKLNFIEKVEQLVVSCAGVISGLSVFVMFVLMVLQVATRYVFASPIYWIEEVTIQLMVLVTVCGGVIALKGYLHPRILVLLDKVPLSARIYVELVLLVPVLLFFGVFIYSANKYAKVNKFIMMSTLDVSLMWVYYGIMLGAVMACIILISDVVNVLYNRRSYIFKNYGDN